MQTLPINAVLPRIHAGLGAGNTLILQAPPGAGKTTLVPLALLDEPWLAGRSILLLEPRRLAARAAAARMAELLGEPVGRTVGYRIRFERKVSRATRIEVLTEGILTRRLQNDPELEGVGLVIFDEQHERSLHTDLALALCRESQQALREDLRLLVMSATLDGAALAALLGDAPIVSSTGRAHPVDLVYLDGDTNGPVAPAAARAVQRALREASGDVLVFLPGGAEIRRTRTLLEEAGAHPEVLVLPLYGDLPQAEQQRAIQPDPGGRRKVVLATPIAETSLTIEGVTVVVDTGRARVPRFDPGSGLTRLETIRISADSAEQRAGRAGRLEPGVCYRLWNEAAQRRLLPRRTPEIREADLAPLVLELAQWGVGDPGELAWLDPPAPGALAQARDLLSGLGALDGPGRITPLGRELAALPVHPRLGCMLLRGAQMGLTDLACDLAAILDERDALRGDETAGCDLSHRVEVLRVFRNKGREGARRLGADSAVCARLERVARSWRERFGVRPGSTDGLDKIGLLLALAYPDRVARRRDGSMDHYRLAGGRGVRLPEHDPLCGRDWLVAAQLDAGAVDGRVYLAAVIELDDIETHLAERIRELQNVRWDERQEAVSAVRERRFGELVLASRALQQAEPGLLRQAMTAGVRRLGLACLPWNRELRDWQARVSCLRQWCPDEGWPDLRDERLAETLEQWLEPYLDGVTRREHLVRLDLTALLRNRLDWSLQARLDQAAPSHLLVPSGSRIRLRYTPGEPPVLAVRLQELFGLAETPRVAGGRVAVTLHLLSPAQRSVQVTRDLRGFWENTYADVKKELKGRYPKHYWPDDPWTATPTRRVRPAGR